MKRRPLARPGRESLSLHVCMLPDHSDGNPYQRELARALERLGVRVTLAKRLADVPLPAGPGQPGGPHVLHLHWTHGFMLDRRAWMTAAKGVRLLAWLVRARRRGLRVAWTVHNLHDHEGRHPWLELFFHRRLVRLCDALIVHCRYARDAVCEAYRVPARLRERVYVIPHGHYLDCYENRLSREDDPAGLEGALGQVLAAGAERLAAMGRHNRERAARWDWDTIARMTRDAYAS